MLPRSTRARLRLAMSLGAALITLWLMWSARNALYPFVTGITFAFILAPVVDRTAAALPFHHTRPGLARNVAVLWVYSATLLLIVAIGVQVAPRMGDQAAELADDVPALVERVSDQIERGSSWYQERVPPHVRRRIDTATQDLATRATGIAEQLVERTIGILTGSVTAVLSYIVVPFWLYYVLKDRDVAARFFYGMFPPEIRDDVRVLAHQASRVLGSYIRAQVLLSTVSGVLTGVGLTLMGIKFSLILGVIAGVANLIPVLGPMVGGVPALLVTAATRPGWMVLWVFLFLFITQNLKDYLLVPRIQGQAVRLHPAVILVLLVVAGDLAGFWGLLVVVPVTAVLRDVFVYVYRRLGDVPALPETAAVDHQTAAPYDQRNM